LCVNALGRIANPWDFHDRREAMKDPGKSPDSSHPGKPLLSIGFWIYNLGVGYALGRLPKSRAFPTIASPKNLYSTIRSDHNLAGDRHSSFWSFAMIYFLERHCAVTG
jgi:hypothetical protein